MDQYATAILIGLMVFNVIVAKDTRGYAFTAIISLLNVAISVSQFANADIYFGPYTQTMVLMVAILCMVYNIRSKGKE